MLLYCFSNKSQFHRATYLLCAVLLAGCVATNQPGIKDQGKKTAPIPQVAASTVLSVEDMQEDLAYTVRILKEVHPKTYHGLSDEQQATIQSAYETAQTPMTAKEFYFVVNSVICSMNDGHTHLLSMQNEHNRFIDVPLIWLQGGLYVSNDRGPFRQTDRIVEIGGKGIETLFQELRQLIPAENDYFRRQTAGQNINREEYLDYLGVVHNDGVEIRVLRGKDEFSIITPLKPKAEPKVDDSKRPWVGYEVDKELSLGVFYLDACRYNETYKKKVRAFFTEISKQNISNIAIDVRRNGGGSSQVIVEFLRYLNIGKYKWFGMDVRFSKAIKQMGIFRRSRGYKTDRRPNIQRNQKEQQSHLLFNGNIYVLTSTQTFSSGNWFAVVVRDNNLGTVIGEPTGNAPSSYGDSPSFQMPKTGFKFTVSIKKWTRPDKSSDLEDSLYPDVLVYTTIEDIKNDRDPQLEKLKEMIMNMEK
jgi:C-terminal processing protease CtpA/Prc